MKKILCLFSFIVTVLIAQAQGGTMKGQNRPPRQDRPGMEMPPPPPPRQMTKQQREKLELFRIQFITKKLDLTKQQREKLELFRIQFITKKLDLSPAEAEKFWPVYNEQREASHNLMQAKQEDEIEFQEAMLVIRKKFKKDLMPILKTEERVNLALKIDRELLNKMRNEMMRRKRPM